MLVGGIVLALGAGFALGWEAHRPPAPSGWQLSHPLVTVPRVLGLSYAAASEAVGKLGLDPRREGLIRNDAPALGAVVTYQNPTGGTRVPEGTSVAEHRLPEPLLLTGAAPGLRLTSRRGNARAHDQTSPALPSAYMRVDTGSTVTLWVSLLLVRIRLTSKTIEFSEGVRNDG